MWYKNIAGRFFGKQSTRVTDRQTDRITTPKTVLAQCRAVKTKPKLKPTLILKNCSCVCVSLCTTVVYNTAQNSSDIFRLQTIIIPQMMSTGGEGGVAPGLQINYGTTICHATSKE